MIFPPLIPYRMDGNMQLCAKDFIIKEGMYGIHVLVMSILALSTNVNQVSGSESDHCRCLASDPCWPTNKIWDAFNVTIGGRLIAPKPTGYCCHDPHINPTMCQIIQANSSNAYLRAENAGSMQKDNWEEKGWRPTCALEAPENTPCWQGRVSALGVRVEQVDDVCKAVQFASYHNLHLVIKSSGHDFLGRSSAEGSFLIWMRKLKNISINESFKVAGKHGHVMPAITVVGGVTWGEIYDALKPTGYIAVGGQALTVCATGGYVQGGGHGALSPSFGLAVDNVLQIEVVTADGELRIVNAYQDPDLFFALRGGGGGTFGVITSITYKIHKIPTELVGTTLVLSPPNGTSWSIETQEAILTLWSTSAVALDAAFSGGYWFFSRTSFTAYFLTPATMSAANNTFKPVVQSLSQIDKVSVSLFMFSVSTFQDWHKNLYSGTETGTDSTGGRTLLGSRIIPFSALQEPVSLARNILSAKAAAGTSLLRGHTVIGPGVRGADPNNLTAVTPAWRRGIWHLTTSSSWAWNATMDAEAAARNMTLAFVKSLQNVYPNAGAYLNEASIDEPGWEQSFWGQSNYAKLILTKLRVDPSGLFVCHKCVGSKLWKRSGNCRVKIRNA